MTYAQRKKLEKKANKHLTFNEASALCRELEVIALLKFSDVTDFDFQAWLTKKDLDTYWKASAFITKD